MRASLLQTPFCPACPLDIMAFTAYVLRFSSQVTPARGSEQQVTGTGPLSWSLVRTLASLLSASVTRLLPGAAPDLVSAHVCLSAVSLTLVPFGSFLPGSLAVSLSLFQTAFVSFCLPAHLL